MVPNVKYNHNRLELKSREKKNSSTVYYENWILGFYPEMRDKQMNMSIDVCNNNELYHYYYSLRTSMCDVCITLGGRGASRQV